MGSERRKAEGRSQEPEARSQKPEARSQKPEAVRAADVKGHVPRRCFWHLVSKRRSEGFSTWAASG
ncbi:hypothetical protein LTR39_004858, partial [Cryomyces antarcticus]